MILAFDPDLHHTAWAHCDASHRLTGGIIEVGSFYKGDDAVREMAIELGMEGPHHRLAGESTLIVESQELHLGHRSAPKDIIRLAQVAGAILGAFGISPKTSMLVSPSTWKGQVPKEIHQARVCKKLGWDFEAMSDHVRPAQKHWDGFTVHKPSDWKHLMDAVGLALWGLGKVSPT